MMMMKRKMFSSVWELISRQEVIKSENKQAFPAQKQTEALFLSSHTQTLPVYLNSKKKKKKNGVFMSVL